MNHKIKSKPITELGSKQLLTYLKLKGLRLGFVLNFRGSLMKDGIERVVNGLSDVNLGSAMSEKYAISRKSFVQLQSFLLLSNCLSVWIRNLKLFAVLCRRSVQFRQNILYTCKAFCCFRLSFCLDQELKNLGGFASSHEPQNKVQTHN